MRVTILTNLFPSSKAPTRGLFNYQKFSALAQRVELQLLVPVPFPEWHRLGPPEPVESSVSSVAYFPYYYTPGTGRRWYGDCLYRAVRGQLTAVRTFSPDVIYGSFLFPDGYAASRLAATLDLPLVIGLHGSDVNVHTQDEARLRKIRSCLQQSNAILSVSEALKQLLVNVGAERLRIHTIYNGVDQARFHPGDQQGARQTLNFEPGRHLIYIGNLLASKGVLDLASAASQLDNDVHIHFIGDGADRGALERIAAQERSGARINIAGRQPHDALPTWLAAADGLCLPSYREGVPNVILEAIACGRPVVASRVGGVPEVTTEDNSILVPPGSISELAAALRTVLKRDWCPQEIAARSKAESWQQVAERINCVLGAAVEEGPRS